MVVWKPEHIRIISIFSRAPEFPIPAPYDLSWSALQHDLVLVRMVFIVAAFSRWQKQVCTCWIPVR